MAVIGTAYVNIRAIATQIKDDIEKSFSGSESSVKKAGEKAGIAYKEGFHSGMGDGPSIDWTPIHSEADDAGRRAAASIQSSLSNIHVPTPDIDTSGVSDAFERDGEEAGRSLERGVRRGTASAENAARNAGDNAGNAFANAFGSASGGGGSSSKLVNLLVIMAPLVLAVVAAASSLASGLFAIGAASAPAAAGLAVLPGLAFAAIGAFVGLKLAFSGVSNALKAAAQQQAAAATGAGRSASAIAAANDAIMRAQEGVQKAAEQNAAAIRTADKRIIDSKRTLAKAIRDAQFANQDSLRSVSLAERALASAQFDAQRAQQSVNDARKEAAAQILDLQFALQDGALGEERAAINLEKARRQLVLMSGLPPDNLLRREAELNYKEAQLNVAKTADQYKKTQEAVENNGKVTVEQTAAVVDAKNREVDAAQRVSDAEYDLAKAKRDADTQQMDSAERVAQAQQDVQDAQADRAKVDTENQRRSIDAQRTLAAAMRQAEEAGKSGTTAANKFNDAMKNLSPAAQEFVRYIQSIKGRMLELKHAAEEGILPGVEDGLKAIMNGGTFDIVVKGIGAISTEVGNAARNIGLFMATPFFQGRLETIFAGSANTTKDFGVVLKNLLSIFVSITAAAQPMTARFTAFVALVTTKWADQAGANGAKMEAFFKRAGDVAAQLGRIIGNIVVGIFKLGQTAVPAGNLLLSSFEAATQKFRALTDGSENQEKFKKFFLDIVPNVQALGKLFNTIIISIAKLGDDKSIAQVSDSFRNLMPTIDAILQAFGEKSGPAIKSFIESIKGVLDALKDSPAFNIFLGIMTTFFNLVTAFASNPAGRTLIFTVASIAASMKALSIIKKLTFIEPLMGFMSKVASFSSANLKKGLDDVQDAVDRDEDRTSTRTNKTASKTSGRAGDVETVASGFEGNLKRLAIQFEKTGVAKDLFMVNMDRLSKKFATTGTAANAGSTNVAGRRARDKIANSTDALDDLADDVAVAGGRSGAGKAASEVAEHFDDIEKKGGKLTGLFKSLGGAAGGLTTAFIGLSAAELAALWPVLLVVAAIAAIVLIFKLAWDRSETLRKAFDEKLKPALEKLWAALKPLVDKMMEFADKALKAIGDFLGDYVLPAVAAFVEFLADKLPGAIEFVIQYLVNFWESLFDIKDAILIAYHAVVDFFNNLGSTVADFIRAAGDWFQGMWDGMLSGIASAYHGVIAFFDSIGTAVADFIRGAGDWFQGVWDGMLSGIATAYHAVIAFFDSIGTAIADWVRGAVDWFVGIWDGMTAGIESISQNIINFLNGVTDTVGGWLTTAGQWFVGLWDGLTSGITTAVDWVRTKLQEMWTFIDGVVMQVHLFFEGMWDGLVNGLTVAVDWVRTKLNEMWAFIDGVVMQIHLFLGGVWDTLINGLVAARDWVFARFQEILTFLSGIAATIGTYLVGLWDNLINGIVIARDWVFARIQDIINFVAGLHNTIANAVGNVFGFFITGVNIAKDWVFARIQDIINFVGGIGNNIASRVGNVFKPLIDGIVQARDWVRERINDILGYFSGIGSRIGSSVSGMWDGIKVAFKNTINAVIGWWNNLSLRIPGFSIAGREVLPSFSLDTPNIPFLAQGGTVAPKSGGTLALIAEAGKSERVTPLNPDGTTNAERRIIQVLELLAKQSRNGPVEQHFHLPSNIDIRQLARQISVELGFAPA